MKESAHGGDLVSARVLWAGEVLDFSANLNPLGMPEGVRRAAAEGVEEAVHYPDPLCRALSAAIARRDGVAPGQVLCGNGAADLVFRLAFSEGPRRALVTAPTFSEYEAAVSAAGCTVVRHILDRARNFDLTGAVLDELTPELDLAFFCTPNNPTGRVIDRGLLEAILEKSRAAGVRLVVDECFLALSDGGEAAGLAGYLEPYPNLLLLRAFTKSYAMPGLRLGYCLSADGALLDRISRCAQPWSVSAPAQAAGLAAAAEPSHPRLARALIARERSRLMRALEGLGLEVIPSAANYLLFRAPGITDLRERLLRRGVLIRSCADYPGLGEDDYRIAVRLQEENEQLIRAMKEAL